MPKEKHESTSMERALLAGEDSLTRQDGPLLLPVGLEISACMAQALLAGEERPEKQ